MQQTLRDFLYQISDPNCKKLLHITHPTVRIIYTRSSELADAVIRNCSPCSTLPSDTQRYKSL